MSSTSLALSEIRRLAKNAKARKPIPVKTQPVISKSRADKEELQILTVKEYASKFFLSESAVRLRINKKKIQSFKEKGRVFIVIPSDAKSGFEYAY